MHFLYAIAIKQILCADAYIDFLCALAYHNPMDITVRSTKQAGAAIRRIRRQKALSQGALGEKMHVRQATVSKLEAGEPATQLRVLMDALVALDLELVIRPRTSASTEDLEDIF